MERYANIIITDEKEAITTLMMWAQIFFEDENRHWTNAEIKTLEICGLLDGVKVEIKEFEE